MSDLAAKLDQLGREWEAMKDRVESRLGALEKGHGAGGEIATLSDRVDALEAGRDRLGPSGSNSAAAAKQRKAFAAFLKSKGEAKSAPDEWMAASSSDYQQKAITIGSDPGGGNVVPEVLERAIARHLEEQSPIRKLARVISVTTAPSSYKVPVSLGGTTSGWVAETATRAETSTPTFTVPSFPDGTLYAYPRATEEALLDWGVSVEAFLAEDVAQQFAIDEGIAFVTGNGTSRPKGFLANAPVTTDDGASPMREAFTLEYVPLNPGASFIGATIQADALITLQHTLRTAYWGRAAWCMNRNTVAAVRRLKETTGQYLWAPGLAAGAPSTLLGMPVVIVDALASPAINALPIVLADFQSMYTILERPTKLLVDPYTTPGYVKFYFSKRMSGHMVDNYAGKVGKCQSA